jgi:hypothetical protein
MLLTTDFHWPSSILPNSSLLSHYRLHVLCPVQACDAEGGVPAGPQDIDNFLRVQAVAFSPDATITSNGLYRPSVLKPGTGLGSDYDLQANYYPIDTSKDHTSKDDTSKDDTSKDDTSKDDTSKDDAQKFADALGRLDAPGDWPVLLQLGERMSKHFRQDIKRWVRKYLFGLEAGNVR